MKTALRIALSVIGMVFAIWLVRIANFFSYVTFVPESEKYGVGLTFYFTVIEIVVGIIYEKCLKLMEERKSYISFVFYQKDQGAEMNSTPKVRNQKDNPAEVWVSLWLKGRSKNLRESVIVLHKSSIFDYQWNKDRRDNAVETDTDGNALIHIGRICSRSKNTDIKIDFRLLIIQKRIGYVRETIEPEIEGKTFRMHFENNKAEIIMGGD